MLFVEIIVAGSFATIIMDLCAKLLTKKKVMQPFISQNELGRWFLYLFKGKIFHQNITTTPSLKNEKLWSLVSHYLIGIALTGFYLYLEIIFPWIKSRLWVPIIYGFITAVFPWFWLLPSINLGVMANKSEKKLKIIRSNVLNHTIFGIGISLWMMLLHPLVF